MRGEFQESGVSWLRSLFKQIAREDQKSGAGFSVGQMSWYQRARDQYGFFVKREYPTMIEECFQTPVEGAI